MARVKLQTEEIKNRKEVKNYLNITFLTVTNLSGNALRFFFNGVERVLPGYDSEGDLGNPPTFEFSSNGHSFDVELNFKGDNNNVLIDYAEIIEQSNTNTNENVC